MIVSIPRNPQPTEVTLTPLAVSVKKCATLLSISERSVWKLLEKKELPFRRVGTRVIIPIAAVNAFLNGTGETNSTSNNFNKGEQE